MKITNVSYGLTKNLGDYESLKIYADAQIDENETPEQALENLRQWVTYHVGMRNETKDLERKKTDLEYDIRQLKSRILVAIKEWDKLKSRWNEGKAFLKIHGIEVNNEFPDLPYLHLSVLNSSYETEADKSDGEDDPIPFG